MADSPQSDFQRASGGRPRGAVSDFIHFLLHNKKWWLIPIAMVLVLMGLLVVLGGTGIAPFIYSIF
ncbi:MAG TPA: DUF5989 family protein [Opitutaceae bacterium]|jgi:hypothetical protein